MEGHADENGFLKLLAALLMALHSHLVPHSEMVKVLRVHVCEEPSWHVNGAEYQGGLGWLHATWLEFRSPGDPWNMATASVTQQAQAMIRFAAEYGWPDLNGTCRGY